MILDLRIAGAAQSGLVRRAKEDRGGALADVAKRSHSPSQPGSSLHEAYVAMEAQHTLLLRLLVIPRFSG